ncbi:DUF790 family protein [Ktedonobacteria bacterium brp13]|nr:DUF790 family protein [Ktedonobacteria bacterium brp13]
MRFSLQDIRKSVQRRGGTLTVSLHFLRSGELQDEIMCLLMYYERQLGESQRTYSLDEARAIIGEYRMAHCLMATLSHWYSWQPRSWDAVVRELGGNEQLLTLTSPVQLRLALYTFVQEHYAGFLSAQQRSTALALFAEQYNVSVSDLEYLLALDSEEETLLTRVVESSPTPEEVAALYNQWVFEAALFNASYVHFVIDCTAFSKLAVPRAPAEAALPILTPNAGAGAVIKRLCFMARKLGVYYDLEYENAVTTTAKTAVTGNAPLLLHLTLYGPQEVTGTPQQYGLRLARLCRMLLGYAGASSGARESGSKPKKANLSGAIIEAEARVHFLQRAYLFALDARLLQLFPGAEEARHTVRETGSESSSVLFDSSIEQLFSEGFSALARDHGVDGWSLEREPEPLLLDKGIFIPDFALTRLQRRIYVEILGFWTPAYRERKLQKLHQLRGRDDLLLVIPVDAREAFAEIEQDFPIVYYKDQISLADLLHVLRQHYDDFAARLALIDPLQVRQTVQQRGLLPDAECATLLHCYRRTEVQQAAALVCHKQPGSLPAIAYVAGLGLYTHSWFQTLTQTFLTRLAIAIAQQTGQTGSLPLSSALTLLRSSDPALQSSADATLETILGLCPELQVQHASIFDATVTLTSEKDIVPLPVLEESEPATTPEPAATPRKSSSRERRSTPKKRSTPPSEVVQGDLWNV